MGDTAVTITLRHSTHPRYPRPAATFPLLAALLLAVLALVGGAFPTPARADGDPASDVLLSQPLFVPQDAGLSANDQAQLGALLAAAHRSGYELRVAVIAGAADLGSLPELWRQPQAYAHFLGQELSLNYGGRLLVVMPNGYGFYSSGGRHAVEQSALGALAAPGPALGRGALSAVERLAAASGRKLPTPAASAPANRRTSDGQAWIVFAVGAVIILLAWAASLRARPPRLLERKTSV